MNSNFGRVCNLAESQHGAVAVWQMRDLALRRGEIIAAARRMVRVHHGVYAIRDLDERGWYRAASLIAREAVISHVSALQLLGLRPFRAGDIHVSVPRGGGRRERDGLRIHRRTRMEVGDFEGIPCTSPAQALKDADLARFELYRALEEAEKRGYPVTLPLSERTVRLKRAVEGYTRSDAEAQFLILCDEHGIALPLVNHRVNGIEADFHWPDRRLILEVDGWEFHKDRAQFEEDRRRELVHAAAGWQVIRASGAQVMGRPELVVGALQTTGW